MFNNITVAIADNHEDVELLMNTLRCPVADDKIGEYGTWDKMYPNVESFLKGWGYSSTEYSKEKLQEIILSHHCLVAEDGSVWEKVNTCSVEYICPWNKDKGYDHNDNRLYRVPYGELIKEIPEEDINIFITDADCTCFFDPEDWDEEDGEWPFQEDTEVYLLHS